MKPRLQNLKNKKILAELLNISILEIQKIIENKEKYYRIKEIKKSDGSPRPLQVPKKELLSIHRIIRKDLLKLSYPEYLHSGLKKRCSVSNADQHLNSHGCLTIDIRTFFPSCKRKAVKDFLIKQLNQSPDIAEIISQIVTYNEHVPTGSTISQIMAFLAAKDVFDELSRYAKNRDLTLTIYVDDITISSLNGPIAPHVKVDVRRILKKKNLGIKNKKTRLYSSQEAKRITGVIVKESFKKAPYNLREKLFSEVLPLAQGDLQKLSPQNTLRSLGLLRAIRRIEGLKVHSQLYHELKQFEVSAQKQVKNQREQLQTSNFHKFRKQKKIIGGNNGFSKTL